MEQLYQAVALFLLVNLVGGLIRVLRGPTRRDRMLAAQLFGTTGVAIMLVLAEAQGQPALRDVGLVFAALAAVNAAVFARLAPGTSSDQRR
jgi:multicomponent Na+:H+ antiporter subunit F